MGMQTLGAVLAPIMEGQPVQQLAEPRKRAAPATRETIWTTASQNQPSRETPSRRVLRSLWSKLAGIYGARFTSAFGHSPEHLENGKHHKAGELTDAGAMWEKGLAGLTPGDIRHGLGRALVSAEPWPPTLPEFRALCLGIPPQDQVLLVLAKPNLQTDDMARFCRLVWRFIDAHRLALADSWDAERHVRAAYDLAKEYRMQLGELPEAPAALIGYQKRPRPTRASRETAEVHTRRLAEILHLDPTTLRPREDDAQSEDESTHDPE